ncbi:uncharacterized protein STEHIDRAFT_100616 [Stereum hirsutum FP-91666 SS1]|uniref:uncharacterized protein n=1 Tax=Stereum hirsutum (strain FP-91666) TaxID=721885 RepID=UPI000444A06D|nr:uncharacterized protein STEHIDRAFT_100616 [Stereum hirsutum FP-91666 SS1]EIM84603.1 hypothetical protein STEHIDRAFT_100616 [Stereum hirsutum FP-91666 SS1]
MFSKSSSSGKSSAVPSKAPSNPKASPGSSTSSSSSKSPAVLSPPQIAHAVSDPTPTVHISSPLNPSTSSPRIAQSPQTTPKAGVTPLPASSTGHTRGPSFSSSTPPPTISRADGPPSGIHLSRGQTHSAPLTPPDLPITRIHSNPLPDTKSTSSISTIVFSAASTFRSRSNSRSRSRDPQVRRREDEEGEGISPGSTWWSPKKHPPRPWTEGAQKKKTIPVEQMEGYVHTKDRVVEAAASVLGTTARVAHEILFAGVDLLRFAPIPGLELAGRTLLEIWDALEMVEMNRLACLRLTERCADILLSVRQEILDAGNAVNVELEAPIAKLNESFGNVFTFLKKQTHRPFLHRYLKRDEILREISSCDAGLSDALGMFGLSIQIRTLKLIQANEARRQKDAADAAELLASSLGLDLSIPDPNTLPPSNIPLLAAPEPTTAIPTPSSPSQIHTLLQRVRMQQNEADQAHDLADLRQLMRTALQTNNDATMIEVLQVGRDEMPEAIKTLQRALEKEVEKEFEAEGTSTAMTITASTSATLEDEEEAIRKGWKPKGLKRQRAFTVTSAGATTAPSGNPISRSGTYVSTHSSASGSSTSKTSKDTLDREFMEIGIDCLRRISGTHDQPLPPWTITRYEVDLERKIGVGFFSDVYKGKWRDHEVAIKVLAETTPRNMFIHEIHMWKTLVHPNVLELLGASSASGDPPWFFVSPYFENGSLVEYLRGLEVGTNVDYLRMVHEVAKGMAYLHSRGVLHGDLKGANILVDAHMHCVISDFGQSEMKSEALRISGTAPPRGTLRWQAPELMSGAHGVLTAEIDVYAFAITCVEIIGKGALPWALTDDDAVRRFVLENNMRPPVPLNPTCPSGVNSIIEACWNRDPKLRPTFTTIERDVERLRLQLGSPLPDSPRPSSVLSMIRHEEHEHDRPSPDMHPIPLPGTSPRDDLIVGSLGSLSSDATYTTAVGDLPRSGLEFTNMHDDHTTERGHGSILFQPSPTSVASSTGTRTPDDSESERSVLLPQSGFLSPPPLDSAAAEARDERRYRMLLQHEYHTSLTLPLWSPAPVAVGAVGYLDRPSGTFVTLFNSYDPTRTSKGRANLIPSLSGYGKVSQGRQRQDKRNAALRGYDMVQGMISRSKGDGSAANTICRTQPFQLRAGHKTAYLYAESTMYRYMEELEVTKQWFQGNIDHILELYGKDHSVTKEDVFLVIGTLEAPDYAMFVSHNHPDGQINFNVYTGARPGQPWGYFSTTSTATLSNSMLGGPVYHESMEGNTDSASKVSSVQSSSAPWDTVLLARLRFKPDVAEPTSL